MTVDAITVFITTASIAEAEKIAAILLENRLIACANLIPGIHSIFRWEDKICRESEILLLLKTVMKNLDEIIQTVKANHSYQIPEIIALPIIAGSADYINWIKTETEKC
ncbi:divalent-cation tolerance protein CutA [candidate division KSB1 bacterium]|nr:divalent-cation tolerance protein CutA [candidate division KSB1 bacterium]